MRGVTVKSLIGPLSSRDNTTLLFPVSYGLRLLTLEREGVGTPLWYHSGWHGHPAFLLVHLSSRLRNLSVQKCQQILMGSKRKTLSSPELSLQSSKLVIALLSAFRKILRHHCKWHLLLSKTAFGTFYWKWHALTLQDSKSHTMSETARLFTH